MKKVILWITGILALLVTICCVVGLLLPTEWHVSQSVVIAASPAEIHPYINRPRRWLTMIERYSATTPEGQGATFQYTFSDVEEGAGAWWISESNAGGRDSKVRIEYTASDPATGIKYDGCIEQDEVNSHGSVTYEEVEGGTRVTWDDRGNLPTGAGAGVFVLEAGIGPFFQGTLEQLKLAVEADETIPDLDAE